MQDRPPSLELLGGIVGAICLRRGYDCGTVAGANEALRYIAAYSRSLIMCLENLSLDDLLTVYDIAERIYRPHARIIAAIKN